MRARQGLANIELEHLSKENTYGFVSSAALATSSLQILLDLFDLKFLALSLFRLRAFDLKLLVLSLCRLLHWSEETQYFCLFCFPFGRHGDLNPGVLRFLCAKLA